MLNKKPGAGMDIPPEAFRRALMDNLPQSIFLKDENSVYIYCNKHFAADLGLDPQEIKGKTDYDFFPGHLADLYREYDRKVISSSLIHEVEEQYIRNGKYITIHTVKVPAISPDGKVEGILGIFWDISERKRLEEEIRRYKDGLEAEIHKRTAELEQKTEDLEKSEHKFKTLFENIADIILIHDFEGRIIEANSKAAGALGLDREKLKTLSLHDIELHEGAGKLHGFSSGIQHTPQTVYQTAFLSADSKSIPVEINSSVFEYGGRKRILAVCRDITERIAAEEALVESSEKLKGSLDKSVEALASASEKRDPYTYGHQERVCRLAVAAAEAMQLPAEAIRALGLAAKIHDIGKLYVPAEILCKPHRLSAPEYAIVKMHTQAGYDITKKIDLPPEVAKTILQHHERLDGSGYPMHLQGGSISLLARILAAADVIEAMTSHRPYRAALALEDALEEISSNKNTLYDPEVADTLIELFESGDFSFRNFA